MMRVNGLIHGGNELHTARAQKQGPSLESTKNRPLRRHFDQRSTLECALTERTSTFQRESTTIFGNHIGKTRGIRSQVNFYIIKIDPLIDAI